MFKTLLFSLFFIVTLDAKDIEPTFKLKSIGFVSDFVVVGEKIFVASDEGVVEVFDLKTQKVIEFITLKPLILANGELQTQRILSIDHLNDKLLIVSIGKSAYRNVWIYENHTLSKLLDEREKLTVKEARFINDEQIFLATFDSEILLFDRAESYKLYKEQTSQSTLGDIVLSEDKSKVILSNESGEIQLRDVNSSKTLQTFETQNLDNVYHVAYANGVILTAGQDRRVGIYRDGEKATHIKSNFLVYCVGLSPSAKVGVYSSGEEAHLQLFETKTKKKLDRLVGHTSIINQIKFINEKELFSSERSPYIYYWKL